jgi:hypothetical protein
VTASLSETLAAVASLNSDKEPFSYAVQGSTIVGTWDIVKATSLYPTEVEHVDKEYAITVSFDEGKGSYDWSDTQTEHHGNLSGGGASFGGSTFKGKSASKEFSFSFGGVNKTDDGVSMKPVVYSFETSRIKDPLFAFLGQHGWQPEKKGFFARLFSH